MASRTQSLRLCFICSAIAVSTLLVGGRPTPSTNSADNGTAGDASNPTGPMNRSGELVASGTLRAETPAPSLGFGGTALSSSVAARRGVYRVYIDRVEADSGRDFGDLVSPVDVVRDAAVPLDRTPISTINPGESFGFLQDEIGQGLSVGTPRWFRIDSPQLAQLPEGSIRISFRHLTSIGPIAAEFFPIELDYEVRYLGEQP